MNEKYNSNNESVLAEYFKIEIQRANTYFASADQMIEGVQKNPLIPENIKNLLSGVLKEVRSKSFTQQGKYEYAVDATENVLENELAFIHEFFSALQAISDPNNLSIKSKLENVFTFGTDTQHATYLKECNLDTEQLNEFDGMVAAMHSLKDNHFLNSLVNLSQQDTPNGQVAKAMLAQLCNPRTI